MAKIEAFTKVHEIMKRYPKLTDYLLELGLCGCEFGGEHTFAWSVEDVARKKNLNLAKLLNELNSRV